jgi:hypothetical protein
MITYRRNLLVPTINEQPSLKDHGFDMRFDENGRPEYHPTDLIKLYIYAYLNNICSSHDLEINIILINHEDKFIKTTILDFYRRPENSNLHNISFQS